MNFFSILLRALGEQWEQTEGAPMISDERDEKKVLGKNQPGRAGGGEQPSREIEILNNLIDAAKTQGYVDWQTFARKPR